MAEVMSDERFANVRINDKIMMGTPYHAIEDEIAETEADLIVMGTTGVSDWEESLIGSTAEKVVRHASCPVLTLRHPVHVDQVNKIVYASDFKDDDMPVIEVIKSIQSLFDAELHLLYINTPGSFKNEREALAGLSQFADHHQLDNHFMHIYNHQNEEEGIVYFTEDHKMDMIMMTTSGRTGIFRLFEHSIAEDVVNFSKKPVATFNVNKYKK
jgi:nucleotide-binding universal stress UspA family protein